MFSENLVALSGTSSVRNLISVVNDNALASGARCIALDQDADEAALYIDTDASTAPGGGIYIDTPLTTTGSVFRLRNANSLTDGQMIYASSGSADVILAI